MFTLLNRMFCFPTLTNTPSQQSGEPDFSEFYARKFSTWRAKLSSQAPLPLALTSSHLLVSGTLLTITHVDSPAHPFQSILLPTKNSPSLVF